MTVLPLTQLWINRVDNGQAVSAQSGRDRSQAYGLDLSVRTYASGRRRAISVAGEQGELSYPLLAVSLATITTLRAWKGILVQVRDHRGQKAFGVFGSVAVGEYMDPTLYRATITIQTVTYTEGA